MKLTCEDYRKSLKTQRGESADPQRKEYTHRPTTVPAGLVQGRVYIHGGVRGGDGGGPKTVYTP